MILDAGITCLLKLAGRAASDWQVARQGMQWTCSQAKHPAGQPAQQPSQLQSLPPGQAADAKQVELPRRSRAGLPQGPTLAHILTHNTTGKRALHQEARPDPAAAKKTPALSAGHPMLLQQLHSCLQRGETGGSQTAVHLRSLQSACQPQFLQQLMQYCPNRAPISRTWPTLPQTPKSSPVPANNLPALPGPAAAASS